MFLIRRKEYSFTSHYYYAIIPCSFYYFSHDKWKVKNWCDLCTNMSQKVWYQLPALFLSWRVLVCFLLHCFQMPPRPTATWCCMQWWWQGWWWQGSECCCNWYHKNDCSIGNVSRSCPMLLDRSKPLVEDDDFTVVAGSDPCWDCDGAVVDWSRQSSSLSSSIQSELEEWSIA